MIPAGSRYEEAERQFTQAHLYNEWGYPLLEGENPNIKVSVANRETLFRVSTLSRGIPEPPLEYYAKESEHMPWLAYKFMGDSRRWSELADANPAVWHPLDLKPGNFIKVPVT